MPGSPLGTADTTEAATAAPTERAPSVPASSRLPSAPAGRRARRAILCGIAILIAAVAPRAYLVSSMPIISRDGAEFILYAQHLADSPVETLRRYRQHPLFPLTVLACHRLASFVEGAADNPYAPWIMAGHVSSFAGGLLAVLAVGVLAGALFNRRTAVVAALCAALLPEFCRNSADVLSDMWHLTFYLLAAALAVRGLVRQRLAPMAAAGLLTGVAFLIRPEGGEVALVACAAACAWPARSWRSRAATAGACAAAFLIIAGPYMLLTGQVVHKKAIGRLLFGSADTHVPDRASAGATDVFATRVGAASGPARERPVHARSARAASVALDRASLVPFVGATDTGCTPCLVAQHVKAAIETLINWVRSLRVMYALPLLAWWLLRPRTSAPVSGGRVAFALWAVHAAVCVLLITRFDYGDVFSTRHAFVLAALTLPWTAAGLILLADYVTARLRRPRAPAWLWAGMAVVVIGPTLPWLLRTPNAGDAYLRTAGEWIRDHYPGPQRILTDRWRVAMYAGKTFQERFEGDQVVRWPGTADAAELVAWVRGESPDLVVLDEHRLRKSNPAFFPELDELAIEPGTLRLVRSVTGTVDGRARGALIYEVGRADIATTSAPSAHVPAPPGP